MITKRIVIGSQSTFFPEGVAFTVPSSGTCGVAAKPGVADTGWISLGPIKWSKKRTDKTEEYMSPQPGTYVAEDEIVLSQGMTLSGKLEKKSNFSTQLLEACATLPAAGTAGGQYNPNSSSAKVRGWLHIQEYDGQNNLVNVIDRWVSLRATEENNDDKAAETGVQAILLVSTLNSGNLS